MDFPTPNEIAHGEVVAYRESLINPVQESEVVPEEPVQPALALGLNGFVGPNGNFILYNNEQRAGIQQDGQQEAPADGDAWMGGLTSNLGEKHENCLHCFTAQGLVIDGKDNLCRVCKYRWCHMCKRNFAIGVGVEGRPLIQSIFPNKCGYTHQFCAMMHMCRFKNVDGVRVARPGWVYWSTAWLTAFSYFTWGLFAIFYYAGNIALNIGRT